MARIPSGQPPRFETMLRNSLAGDQTIKQLEANDLQELARTFRPAEAAQARWSLAGLDSLASTRRAEVAPEAQEPMKQLRRHLQHLVASGGAESGAGVIGEPALQEIREAVSNPQVGAALAEQTVNAEMSRFDSFEATGDDAIALKKMTQAHGAAILAAAEAAIRSRGESPDDNQVYAAIYTIVTGFLPKMDETVAKTTSLPIHEFRNTYLEALSQLNATKLDTFVHRSQHSALSKLLDATQPELTRRMPELAEVFNGMGLAQLRLETQRTASVMDGTARESSSYAVLQSMLRAAQAARREALDRASNDVLELESRDVATAVLRAKPGSVHNQVLTADLTTIGDTLADRMMVANNEQIDRELSAVGSAIQQTSPTHPLYPLHLKKLRGLQEALLQRFEGMAARELDGRMRAIAVAMERVDRNSSLYSGLAATMTRLETAVRDHRAQR